MSYTTPHYYPKYEIWAIENFLVEDPFNLLFVEEPLEGEEGGGGWGGQGEVAVELDCLAGDRLTRWVNPNSKSVPVYEIVNMSLH